MTWSGGYHPAEAHALTGFARAASRHRPMYAFYLAYDWLSNNVEWGVLGTFVLVGTVAINLGLDHFG